MASMIKSLNTKGLSQLSSGVKKQIMNLLEILDKEVDLRIKNQEVYLFYSDIVNKDFYLNDYVWDIKLNEIKLVLEKMEQFNLFEILEIKYYMLDDIRNYFYENGYEPEEFAKIKIPEDFKLRMTKIKTEFSLSKPTVVISRQGIYLKEDPDKKYSPRDTNRKRWNFIEKLYKNDQLKIKDLKDDYTSTELRTLKSQINKVVEKSTTINSFIIKPCDGVYSLNREKYHFEFLN